MPRRGRRSGRRRLRTLRVVVPLPGQRACGRSRQHNRGRASPPREELRVLWLVRPGGRRRAPPSPPRSICSGRRAPCGSAPVGRCRTHTKVARSGQRGWKFDHRPAADPGVLATPEVKVVVPASLPLDPKACEANVEDFFQRRVRRRQFSRAPLVPSGTVFVLLDGIPRCFFAGKVAASPPVDAGHSVPPAVKSLKSANCAWRLLDLLAGLAQILSLLDLLAVLAQVFCFWIC